jgi:hypothetical protein
MDSLLHELTVRSQGLDTNARIAKVGAVEIVHNVLEMIGLPEIIVVENSDESPAGRFDPAV